MFDALFEMNITYVFGLCIVLKAYLSKIMSTKRVDALSEMNINYIL